DVDEAPDAGGLHGVQKARDQVDMDRAEGLGALLPLDAGEVDDRVAAAEDPGVEGPRVATRTAREGADGAPRRPQGAAHVGAEEPGASDDRDVSHALNI